MTKDELNSAYFDWMYRLVCSERNSRKPSHQKLLLCLHSIDFRYSIPMDGNREEDGTDLRYRFGYEKSYEGPIIASYLDDRPCSVLEMLIALAMRCEEHIMDDPEAGNRTGQWFWSMISNLGLGFMTDAKFDRSQVARIITRFLDREYEATGEGGLFTVRKCPHDLRTLEIWYQMCWHLNDIL